MRPVLLSKAVMRADCNTTKPFHYDADLDINVLNENPRLAFIDVNKGFGEKDIRELYTKTEEYRERDDEDIDVRLSGIALEAFSKTYADRERDDEDDSYFY